MKRLLGYLLCLVLLFSFAQAEEFALPRLSQEVSSLLLADDYAALVSRFDENMASALTEEALSQTMQALALQYGPRQQDINLELFPDRNAVVLTLHYARSAINLTVIFNEAEQISGMFVQPAAVEPTSKELVQTAAETSLTLFAGTERELSARLITPENEQAPYVIFVHGSGASDMDETIGPNKPFRDLAYDLAALGVGSLRFDKITYAHPALPCDTVIQEYLEPVTEALRVLREHASPSAVYVIGHSEGGMLAPWLTEECGFDGAVVMAGTPKTLWEIQWMQNMAVLAFVPREHQEAQQAFVQAEVQKASRLLSMSEAELASTTLFGLSAVYHRSIAELDEIALVKDSGKPFLFLWGDCDLQVDRASFEAWQEGLNEYEKAEYIVYPGLNHLFLTAQEDDSILSVQEAYSRPETIGQQISQDIADWIHAQ